MLDACLATDLAPGAEIAGPDRVLTVERLRRYSIGIRSAARGEYAEPAVNIHTDEAFAKNQGLPAPIGDGMITTNWCSSMLLDYFGADYLRNGELRTKYIKPTFTDDVISVRGKVLDVTEDGDGAKTYRLDIWCENQQGQKIVDGHAVVTVPRR